MNKLAYCPLSIKKWEYDPEQILTYFNQHKMSVQEHDGPQNGLDKILQAWESVFLRSSQLAKKENKCTTWYKYEKSDRSWQWDNRFKEKFPAIVAGIEALPFEYITFVALFRNIADIPLHQDRMHFRNETGEWMGHKQYLKQKNPNMQFYQQQRKTFEKYMLETEPSSYRAILYGERNQSFIISKDEKIENSHFISLPEQTDVFAMNTNNIYHGARGRSANKILLYISGFLDKEKHQKLISKSSEEFKSSLIQF